MKSFCNVDARQQLGFKLDQLFPGTRHFQLKGSELKIKHCHAISESEIKNNEAKLPISDCVIRHNLPQENILRQLYSFSVQGHNPQVFQVLQVLILPDPTKIIHKSRVL